MSWAIQYQSVNLNDTNGVTIEKVKDSPQVKMKVKEALSDGVAIERYSRGGRKIRIEGMVKGSTQSQLDTRVDSLIKIFSNPEGGDLYLNADRKIKAYPKIGALELVKGSSNLALSFTAELLTEETFWKATSTSTATKTLSTSGTNTGTFTASVSGTAPVRPLIRITQKSGTSSARSTLNLTLTNLSLTEQEFIRITNGALGNDSDRIILDSDTETVYLENDSSSNSKVPKRVDGTFFELQPGSNTVYVDAMGSGGNLTVTLIWYEQYYSSGF